MGLGRAAASRPMCSSITSEQVGILVLLYPRRQPYYLPLQRRVLSKDLLLPMVPWDCLGLVLFS